MTKFVGPIDAEAQARADQEKEPTVKAHDVLEQIAKDFGAKVEPVRVAVQSEAQANDPSPMSESEQHAPNMEPGRALVFNEPMTDSVDSDTSDVYFRKIRRAPGYQPQQPSSNYWKPWWANYSRFLMNLDWLFMQSSKQIRVLSGWVKHGYELGNHFRRDPWMYIAPKVKGIIGEDYHSVVQGINGPILEALRKKIETLSDDAIAEIPYAMRGANVNPATGRVQLKHLSAADALWFRNWLDDVLQFTNQHMQGNTIWGTGNGSAHVTANDIIKRLPNYFPQLWELDGKFGTGPFRGARKETVAHAFFKGLGFFTGQANQDEEITALIHTIMGDGGFVSYAATNQWRSGTVTKLTPRIRNRLLNIDPNASISVTLGGVTAKVSLNDLLNNNPLTILPRYAIGMARQGEFNRRFGPKGQDIDRMITGIQSDRKAAGLGPLVGEDLFALVRQVQANLNTLQNRPSRTWNRRQELIKAAVNTNMLFFTTLASLPEALMPGVRLGLRGQLSAFNGGIKQILSTLTRQGDTDAKRIARDLGIIRDHLQTAILDYATTHASFAVGRWNVDANGVSDWVFRKTMLTGWTNFTKVMATAAAIRALPRWAEKAAAGGLFANANARFLQEVGLTHHDLAGFDPDTYQPGSNTKIDAAIRQMVGEIIIESTPGMKPGWMSDPNFKLVSQIKSFIVGYGNTVLQRPIREAAHGNPFPLIALVAYAAVAALTAQLWEWLTYGDAGNPSWHRAGLDQAPAQRFMLRMQSRGGLAGPYQFLVDAITLGRSAQGGSAAGQWVPAATLADRVQNLMAAGARWIYSLGDNPRALHEVVTNATLLVPGLSQSGAFRRYLVDSIAPSPHQPPTPFPTWTGTAPPPGGHARPPPDPYGGGARRDPYGGRGRDPYR